MYTEKKQKISSNGKCNSGIILKNSIILFSCFAIITGLLAGIANVKKFDGFQVFQAVLQAFLCYRWCVTDAKERQFYKIGRMAIWSAIFPPFGIPIYIFKTRAKRDAIVAMFKILIYMISYELLIILTFVISSVLLNSN